MGNSELTVGMGVLQQAVTLRVRMYGPVRRTLRGKLCERTSGAVGADASWGHTNKNRWPPYPFCLGLAWLGDDLGNGCLGGRCGLVIKSAMRA